jgi:hypothetical protein
MTKITRFFCVLLILNMLAPGYVSAQVLLKWLIRLFNEPNLKSDRIAHSSLTQK